MKALPGVSDTDAAEMIRGRPYNDKNQLVAKKAVSAATYEKIKDHVVAQLCGQATNRCATRATRLMATLLVGFRRSSSMWRWF